MVERGGRWRRGGRKFRRRGMEESSGRVGRGEEGEGSMMIEEE